MKIILNDLEIKDIIKEGVETKYNVDVKKINFIYNDGNFVSEIVIKE